VFKSVPVAFSLIFSLSTVVIAEETADLVDTEQDARSTLDLDKIYITGGEDEIRRLPGSATLIDEVALEAFEYTDIHRILNSVPGVNLQEEDGYGLRPNIGLRGTSPERSKKVTLMEDGVLSGPAPYSAPAAYYFPNVSRMSAVEVFKGPATTQYGPATIGGAVNLVSRAIPFAGEGELDAQYGQYNFQRYNAYYGEQMGDFGYLIEGLNVSTDGFKDLDAGPGNTGFTRNDLNLKTSWQMLGEVSQIFQLKLGYADEDSNETYLGLSRDDFDADPYRRYAASQLDNMQWDHNQIQLSHNLEFSSGLTFNTDVYYNTYQRDWFKVNGFDTNTTSIQDVLKNPTSGNNPDFYKVLTGEASASTAAERIRIGNNGRKYISQGIQTRANFGFDLAGLSNEMELGLRYHQDQIERHHSEQLYAMQVGGNLNAEGNIYSTTRNKGEATAIAVYVKDDISYEDTTLTLGLRSEQITAAQTDYDLNDGSFVSKTESNESVLLPGIGIYSQLHPTVGILAGVHKGYSATSPGQEGDVEPEESLNYELGARFNFNELNLGQGELIAFYNDYSQLTGSCSFSNGCNNSAIDSQVNAGEALVYGVEAAWKLTSEFAGFSFPASMTYTFTQAEFGSNFRDDSGAFGDSGQNIVKGDELAYVPQHRLNAQLGMQRNAWKANLSALYQSEMRDTPGQGAIADNEIIDAYVVIDASASYQVLPALQVYGTIDNLVGSEYVVASQPYGYRPGKPRSANLGVKYKF
jgi:Fe(3+) dicitrate transport protein